MGVPCVFRPGGKTLPVLNVPRFVALDLLLSPDGRNFARAPIFRTGISANRVLRLNAADYKPCRQASI